MNPLPEYAITSGAAVYVLDSPVVGKCVDYFGCASKEQARWAALAINRLAEVLSKRGMDPSPAGKPSPGRRG